MLFAQFFPAGGSSHARFLILDSLESHGYYSEEYTAEVGDFEARDLKGNTGLLKVWSYGGAPEEIETVIEAYAGGERFGDTTEFAAWLLREVGASDSECEQLCEAAERIVAAADSE
jgi:hypothetical protein